MERDELNADWFSLASGPEAVVTLKTYMGMGSGWAFDVYGVSFLKKTDLPGRCRDVAPMVFATKWVCVRKRCEFGKKGRPRGDQIEGSMVWISLRFVELMNLLAPLFGRRPVRHVDTDELGRMLESDDHPVVLVDVRSDEEIAVSRIPGAISEQEFLSRKEEFVGQEVVAYCTIGGRSLLFAQRLQRLGVDAANYRGSILDWCAEGKPLTRGDGTPTKQLHTHNRLFQAPAGYQRVV